MLGKHKLKELRIKRKYNVNFVNLAKSLEINLNTAIQQSIYVEAFSN